MLLAEACSVPPPKEIVPEAPIALAFPSASVPAVSVAEPGSRAVSSVQVPEPSLTSAPLKDVVPVTALE